MSEEQSPQESQSSTDHTAHKMLQDPQFKELARRKTSISLTMTAIMMLIYFGFIFLMAFAPGTLKSAVGSATLGIPLGIGVIMLAWILTGIYVRWANSEYDEMVARVKERL
ncbi:MAG TPA: DUF485 domain-containing protein [Abditibacteriaceae bacterium]|jgi:uncharacterized membrane protein (DUF485 family)